MAPSFDLGAVDAAAGIWLSLGLRIGVHEI